MLAYALGPVWVGFFGIIGCTLMAIAYLAIGIQFISCKEIKKAFFFFILTVVSLIFVVVYGSNIF